MKLIIHLRDDQTDKMTHVTIEGTSFAFTVGNRNVYVDGARIEWPENFEIMAYTTVRDPE